MGVVYIYTVLMGGCGLYTHYWWVGVYYSICIAECLNIYTQGYYRNHILNVYAVSFNGLHEETVVVQLVAYT